MSGVAEVLHETMDVGRGVRRWWPIVVGDQNVHISKQTKLLLAGPTSFDDAGENWLVLSDSKSAECQGGVARLNCALLGKFR